MGRKCSVEGCSSDSSRPEDTGVTFHKVPTHNDIRPKWFSLCRIPADKKSIKVIYVCSRHFLRADFCNFKGKKYMLKQGVLPSVFPWDKSKLEAIKAEVHVKKEDEDILTDTIKTEVETESDSNDCTAKNEDEEEVPCKIEIKEELVSEDKVAPKENVAKVEPVESPKLVQTSQGNGINFTINSRIEVLDFNDSWYPARIVEVDYEENEVLIHFEKFSSKYDEWICMDSARLRPVQPSKKTISSEHYIVGERCLATWSDSRKFPATVTKILENDMYEVLFDDGFVKSLKAHRMSKAQGKPIQSSPLFDPVKGTKQERRDKKRKLNVAELFGKRTRMEHNDDKEKTTKASTSAGNAMDTSISSPLPDEEQQNQWPPIWADGRPIGMDSSIDTNDGKRKTVIVADPRLPEGWKKHFLQRQMGTSAGKWDCLIVSPDNRKFRSKAEVRAYYENHPELEYNETLFDFSTSRQRQRKSTITEAKKNLPVFPEAAAQPPTLIPDSGAPAEEVHEVEGKFRNPHDYGPPFGCVRECNDFLDTEMFSESGNPNALKIPVVDDVYKCPIEGCGKNFRRENLAQMHVKHYHPEYTKFLDCTPNVADLAYARTVGENLDKSPTIAKPSPLRQSLKLTTPKVAKLPQSPLVESDIKPHSPTPSKTKDSEIIKLLSAKPFDKKETETIHPLPSGLPSSMYPDIKLKDLLNRSEAMPKRDDLNLRTLCASRPPVGIKTLLPVVRPTEPSTHQDEPYAQAVRQSFRRRRGPSENFDYYKGKEQQAPPHDTPILPQSAPSLVPYETLPQYSQPPNNIIIEGGEVIKIVRMKQEEIINCTCGFTEEDGLMIQCELCLCWQHAYCNNIERESQVPDKYICYICQNPARERVSKKYIHDQDWLKQGTLPSASYHSKDEDLLQKRFEKLKKAHDVSGALMELANYLHNLNVKIKISEVKNHPKLYLWSKPWEKLPLPEKVGLKQEDGLKRNLENDQQEQQHDSMLMMMFKDEKELPKIDLNTLMGNHISQICAPVIPRPEAPIDSADCRLNLLDHIAHCEALVEERLDDFEKLIDDLTKDVELEADENYPNTRQTLQMLLRDLDTLREFGQVTSVL